MAISVVVKNQKLAIGDTIRITQQYHEDEKLRLQSFEGTLIAIKGQATGRSITVRRISANNIGVERIWPINSPTITQVSLVKKGKVRRAKLYYLRERVGKRALKVKTADKIQTKEKVKVNQGAKK